VAAASSCGGGQSPTAPATLPVAATPGRHEVAIAGDGVMLGGYLYRPDTTDSRPAVVLLHGWQTPGTNGAAVLEARARQYANEGYVALALALRGWPPSGGADDCGLRQPADVVTAIGWLRAQTGVTGDRIGLVGFSQGGQVALLAAARDARVRAAVAYYPVTDVARWKATTTNPDIPTYITSVCEPGGVAARSPLQHADTIAAPVLLVHGDRDTRVPTEQSLLLHAARERSGRPSELLLIPGAQHGFNGAEEAIARPVVDAFLATWLR
jgi:dipeptidyl aminopeptidase/acylaminoacyl peptidase